MKKILAVLLVIGIMIGGGYYLLQREVKSQPTKPTVNDSQKQGDTILQGRIQKSGQNFVLLKEDGQTVFVDSYSLDLADHVGQEVTVVGQYSGDELFIREIN